MKKVFTISIFYLGSLFCNAQTAADFIKECNLSILKTTMDELSGEVSTQVNGNTVTIKNRVSSKGNDMAADYIKQKLTGFGLTPVDQVYKAGATGGRNVYAIQTGKTKPNDIYIICGHYDAMADYCADDNLSGTITVLEAARILSKYCFDNTIIYAFWDEEEIGLVGSKYYATAAKNKKDNILGVLNIDMNAYDGDNDKNFDIDLNNNTSSAAIKDLLLKLVDTHKLNLIGNVVNPGTSASDHASFWPTYGALLLGECWSKEDKTPFYHTAKDRANTLNWNYYFEMVKLAVAYIGTVGGPVKQTPVTIDQVNNVLTATPGATAYQWLDCNNANAPVAGQTGQSFTVTKNGSYAVKATFGGCNSISSCVKVTVSGMDENKEFADAMKLFPNPAQGEFSIDLGKSYPNTTIEITDVNGRLKYRTEAESRQLISLHLEEPAGIYFVTVRAAGLSAFLKLVVTNP